MPPQDVLRRLPRPQRVSLAVVKGEGEIVATAVLREKTDQLLRDMTPPGA